MNEVNQKIIDAVIKKAEKICPESLALIGIYGSVASGDEYEKSDLDLLILIQDNRGWQLGTGFILEDSGIGYDIYCTNWDGLREDSKCHHAQISKLMDSKIVYIKNQQAYEELCRLREQTRQFLASEERDQRVDELINKAKIAFANAYLHDSLGQVRMDAYEVIYDLCDAMMLFHGRYFRLGVKRMLEELASIGVDGCFLAVIKKIVVCKDISEMRGLLGNLLAYSDIHLRKKKEKAAPSKDLAGTYEEMFSNWRNKMEEAAEQGNAFASFMNLCSLQNMLDDIASEVTIGTYSLMEKYDPDHLAENVRLYDECLQQYEAVYKQAGINVRRYQSVDDFVANYFMGSDPINLIDKENRYNEQETG